MSTSSRASLLMVIVIWLTTLNATAYLYPEPSSDSTAQAALALDFTAAAPATVVPTTQHSVELQKALDYAQSSPRAQRFERAVPKAGRMIAHALEAGRFGPVYRYNEDKDTLRHSYVGWGGIQAKNRRAFARVYWVHGRIDYTKPIHQVSITPASGASNQEVMMFGPDNPYRRDDILGSYWTVYYDTPGPTLVGDLTAVDNPELNDYPSGKPEYHSPTSQAEFEALDAMAFDRLNYNMKQRFGKFWPSV